MNRRWSVLLGSLGLGAMLVLLTFRLTGPAVSAGPVRFVDDQGAPIASERLRILCFASAGPNPVFRGEQLANTDSAGIPQPPLGNNCPFLAALRERHVEPSGKPGHGPAFRVYATSWLPGSDAPQPASGDVALRDDRPLVLFDIAASVGWQPSADDDSLLEIRRALMAMSAYLYDLGEGQLGLGQIRIQGGGVAWEGADLRFLPANDYRPSAYIGGIVPAARAYTTTNGVATRYAPAMIYLGRYWDGANANNPIDGRWDLPPAWRTLAHEWAHYALFLYDEYQAQSPADVGETFCVCDDLPAVGVLPGACGGVSPALAASVMAYHYTADEWWHPNDHGAPASCAFTQQANVHGESDWETLEKWGTIQGLTNDWLQAPQSLDPGPGPGLAAHLFGAAPGERRYLPSIHQPGQPAPVAAAPTVTLHLSPSLPLTPTGLYPQVYLVEPAAAGAPERVTYQGSTLGTPFGPDLLGPIPLLGVGADTQAHAYVDHYTVPSHTQGARLLYPGPGGSHLPLVDGQQLTLVTDTLAADLAADFDLTGPRLTVMTLTLRAAVTPSVAPLAQLCDPGERGCPDLPAWRQTMVASGPLTWRAVLEAEAGSVLPHFGLVRVTAGSEMEVIRWVQVAGGVGPGHIEGDAPLRDGSLMVDALAPVSGERNRVVFMPAASTAAINTPLPPGIAGIVGVPYDIDILLPGGAPLAPAGGDRTLPVPVRLTFFYTEHMLTRLKIAPHLLTLLHFERATGIWVEVAVDAAGAWLPWLTSEPVSVDGIYAIGYARPTLFPPTPAE